MTESAISRAEIDAAAADWFARLQGDAEIETWTEFQTWLEANAAHAKAYEAVESLWLDLEDPAITPPVDEVEPMADNVVAFRPKTPRTAWWLGGGAAAAAAAALAVVMLPQALGSRPVAYSTAKGETSTAVLADGSQLTLGPDTQLQVRLTRGERHVDLLSGEAAFDVAHQPDRPFTVALGDHEVRVLGTEFDIRRQAGALSVTVRRGVVAVKDSKANEVRLTKGRQLIAVAGATTVVKDVNPDDAFAWKTGALVYQDAPLSQVATDLSRYGAAPVRADASAAKIQVTGVLRAGDQQKMLENLYLFAPVTGSPSGGEIVLKARPTAR